MSAPSEFVARVLALLMVTMFADLESRMSLPRIALFRTATREWAFDSDARAPRPSLEWLDESIRWVGVLSNDVFVVNAQTVPHLLVELVARLQRLVLASTGREWPEVYRDGQFAGLAIPAVGCEGIIGWSVLGGQPVPFGSLA